jgi:hypothetical protein
MLQPAMLSAQSAADDDVGEPRVGIRADRQELRVGDSAQITRSASYPAGYSIAGSLGYPAIEGLQPSGVNMISKTTVDGATVEEASQTFRALREGRFVIDPITVRFRTPSGETINVKSNGLTIVVLPEGAPEEGLRDIKGLRELKRPFDWLLVTVIAAIAAALITLVLVISGMRARRVGTLTPPKMLSHEDEYIELLRRLTIPEEFDAIAVKNLYLKISEYVRSYLAAKWDITAREETTLEVLGELEKGGFGGEVIDGYSDVSRALDMVKYAKGRPFSEDINAARNAAIDFIRLMGGTRR